MFGYQAVKLNYSIMEKSPLDPITVLPTPTPMLLNLHFETRSSLLYIWLGENCATIGALQ